MRSARQLLKGTNPSFNSIGLHSSSDGMDRTECYVVPEVIESTIFRQLDGFLGLSSTANLKYGDLGDFFMELQSAKEDGYLL